MVDGPGTGDEREWRNADNRGHFDLARIVGDLRQEPLRVSYGGGGSPPAPAAPPSKSPDWSKPIDPSSNQVTLTIPIEAWARCFQNSQHADGQDAVSIGTHETELGLITGTVGMELSGSEHGPFFSLNFNVDIDGQGLFFVDRQVAEACLKRLDGDKIAQGIVSLMIQDHARYGRLAKPEITIEDQLKGLKKVCEVYFDTLLQFLGVRDASIKLSVFPRERPEGAGGDGGPGASGAFGTTGASQRVAGLLQETDVKLADIGGYAHVKQEVERLIRLFRHESHYESFLVKPPRGILFAGPPGTGKTLFAKAMCNELGVNFYHVSTSDVLNAYYGESEKRLAEIFDNVQTPCVIFVDELEALAAKRDHASEPSRRVLTELLRKLDGMASREGILFLGATNKLEMLDPAITRAGRLDRTIVVDKPDVDAREQIFKVCIQNYLKGSAPELDWLKKLDPTALARASEGLVGADIQEVTRRIVFAIADERLLRPEGEWRPSTDYARSVIEQYQAELEFKKGGNRL